MKKRHVMRTLLAVVSALALTACGSGGAAEDLLPLHRLLHLPRLLHRRQIPRRLRLPTELRYRSSRM